jgi:hypothetical protein
MRTSFKIITVVVCALAAVFSFTNSNTDIKPARILLQMYDSIKNVKTLRMSIAALERVNKKYTAANSELKVLTNPRKLYFHNYTKKIEVLFNAELYNHKALVRPNVFPYMTLSLDPTGNLMRRNQHYTINELGYDFIGKSVALTISKDKDGLNNFTYLGKHVKNSYNCYMLEYENKAYAYTDYTVGEKETTGTISYKLCVNEYLLRDKNDLLNDFGFLKKGKVLKVPNLYCKKAVLYIDDKMMLPVSISLYDDLGLFENYDYTNVQVNKPFSEDEFLKQNKLYNF